MFDQVLENAEKLHYIHVVKETIVVFVIAITTKANNVDSKAVTSSPASVHLGAEDVHNNDVHNHMAKAVDVLIANVEPVLNFVYPLLVVLFIPIAMEIKETVLEDLLFANKLIENCVVIEVA